MSWGWCTHACRRRSPNCTWSDQNRGICYTYQIYSSVDYMVEPHVFFAKANHSVSGWQQQVVKEFQYLWVLLNSTLTFEAHIIKVCKILGFNQSNIHFTRGLKGDLSIEAATLYVRAMIFTHIKLLYNKLVRQTLQLAKHLNNYTNRWPSH